MESAKEFLIVQGDLLARRESHNKSGLGRDSPGIYRLVALYIPGSPPDEPRLDRAAYPDPHPDHRAMLGRVHEPDETGDDVLFVVPFLLQLHPACPDVAERLRNLFFRPERRDGRIAIRLRDGHQLRISFT